MLQSRVGHRRYLGRATIAFSLVLVTGCGPVMTAAKGESVAIRSTFGRAATLFDRLHPKPAACEAPWESSHLYVVQVTNWASDAGLRRGDRIAEINGNVVTDLEDKAEALQKVPVGGPLIVRVQRGNEHLSITLPCREGSKGWTLSRQMLLAGAQGNWDQCISAADELAIRDGMASYGLLLFRLKCFQMKMREGGIGFTAVEANMIYSTAQTRLEESRYEPGGLARVRSHVLLTATDLRARGFSSLALSLESQLGAAEGPKSSAPRQFSPERQERAPKEVVLVGSGFFVSRQGHVLTNNHVVKGCSSALVKIAGGQSYNAAVVARDRENDLALLSTSQVVKSVATFYAGSRIRPGDLVVVVGYPLHGLLASPATVTTGVVSALAGPHDDKRLLQITAPVQAGNSGGPLLDERGNVIGIVVGKLDALKVAGLTGDLPENVNFAINASLARAFLEARQVVYETAAPDNPRNPADIGEIARGFTVLVECHAAD